MNYLNDNIYNSQNIKCHKHAKEFPVNKRFFHKHYSQHILSEMNE